MKNALEVLEERGFLEQFTHENETKELFEKEKITFYIGFDPTADSLHVGHFVTVMAMAHMQKAGHRPICLMGGGTGMIGDPSGKSDMRKLMTVDDIDYNVRCFKKQLSRFIDFSDDKAIIVDNKDWIRNINYIDFLREIGVHFSVNRMLTADCFKSRMEKGLSFLEFNYMLMQANDFLELNKTYGCVMQLGGNDQWSNIIAGVDLIRRKESKPAFGMTFTLLTNSEGNKMGKTEKGALWLDAKKTSPYEFYQYWRNIGDKDVEKCLSLLTFLPMEEVRRLGALEDSEINKAKEILAFEITKTIHGEEEAKKAEQASKALFAGGAEGGSIPETLISEQELGDGIDILTLLTLTKLCASKSEGRRVIEQGGLKLNRQKVDAVDVIVTKKDFDEGKVLLQKGKKAFHQVKIF